jgi:hypothetical protein
MFTCKNRQSPTALTPVVTPTPTTFSELWRTEQRDLCAIFLTWRPSATLGDPQRPSATLGERRRTSANVWHGVRLSPIEERTGVDYKTELHVDRALWDVGDQSDCMAQTASKQLNGLTLSVEQLCGDLAVSAAICCTSGNMWLYTSSVLARLAFPNSAPITIGLIHAPNSSVAYVCRRDCESAYRAASGSPRPP